VGHHGDIRRLLVVAPLEVWRDFWLRATGIRRRYSQITGHAVKAALPFEGIDYVELRAA